MAAAGNAYMGASDAFSWYMERDPALRSTVTAIVWLDRAPDWDLLTGRVDRLSRIMPALRQRVVEPPFRLATPRWTCAPDFDLSWHARRIAAPGPRTRDEVLEVARRAATEPFDRDRPLWRLILADGLESGAAALVIKFHHSLSDGVGGMRTLAILADLQREPADLGELPPAPPGETLDSLGLVSDALRATAWNYVRSVPAGDRSGDPGPGPLRARSRRPGPRRRRDGPIRLPDGRAERRDLVASYARTSDGTQARHDRGAAG